MYDLNAAIMQCLGFGTIFCIGISSESKTQTKFIVDWLAESESNFLGHKIGIIWPINNVHTIVT